MFFRRKKKIRKALSDKNLQKALERASSKFYQNFKKSIEDIDWEKLKKKAREIKEKSTDNLLNLIVKFSEEAKKSGSYIYFADEPKNALEIIGNILEERKAKLVVKAKSMVSEEIGLNKYLEKKGIKVIETDLGEWIAQISGDRPSHLTAPVVHKTKEEIAKIIGKHLNQEIPPEPEKITEIARKLMREYFINADAGISGANLGIAESGTLVIISNEGNARLATSLPPIHIALLSCEKIVGTIEEAGTLIKTLTHSATGQKLTSYVSFITGPSRTADIEKKLVLGAHGPKEVHIILINNKRLEYLKDPKLKEILYCLKCGGCMLVCPVYQEVGGHIFGGDVYPGGIGLLFTALTSSPKYIFPLLDLCSDCKKCEEFCPVGIKTGELLLDFKLKRGGKFFEKLGSSFISRKKNLKLLIKILSPLQKYYPKLPFSWTKNKILPELKVNTNIFNKSNTKNKKVYLFLGCMVRYFYNEIGEKAEKLLSSLGWEIVIPEEQVCCGAPFLHLGNQKIAKKLALENLKSFNKHKPEFIITLCPTGNWMFKEKYPSLIKKNLKGKIFDFAEFLGKNYKIKELKNYVINTDKKIFYHQPCHYASISTNGEFVKLLKALGYKVEKEIEPLKCCGFSGVFSFKNPEISEKIWEKKKNKILKYEPELIVTNCPGCIFQIESHLKKTNPNIKVLHFSQLFS